MLVPSLLRFYYVELALWRSSIFVFSEEVSFIGSDCLMAKCSNKKPATRWILIIGSDCLMAKFNNEAAHFNKWSSKWSNWEHTLSFEFSYAFFILLYLVLDNPILFDCEFPHGYDLLGAFFNPVDLSLRTKKVFNGIDYFPYECMCMWIWLDLISCVP